MVERLSDFLPTFQVRKSSNQLFMLVKNTFQTLFEISDSGMKLVADFVTRSEAEEWAADNQVMSYVIMETVVMHEVVITTRVQPARALRISGDVDPEGSGDEPLKPRSGPVTGVRTGRNTPAATVETAATSDAAVKSFMQKLLDLLTPPKNEKVD